MGLIGIIFILIHKQKPEKILIFATCLHLPDHLQLLLKTLV